ncbi:TcaA NTF2-like domain-containing protein [Caryophanon latum]|uniref:TcaA protein NTF2-like domain-containing protein n=1 Tax=Caryophanon latum TaxID=33977 RepID=A0A1C0YTA0_9BACL|nr:zinc ribbon domain-containing protein [Caryophanon latum]OCS90408.1 hypothetical protein A6K76_11120 [Caryophanon latum]
MNPNICPNEACRQQNDAHVKFCIHCGHTLAARQNKLVCQHDYEGDAAFCRRCGERRPFPRSFNKPTTVAAARPEATTPKIEKKRSRKALLPLVLIAIFAMLSGGTWVAASSYFANEKQLVEQLQQAADTQNTELFLDALTIDASDEQKEAYETYIHESDVLSNRVQSILSALDVLKNDERTSITTAISSATVNEYVITKEKKLGLFPYYSISPLPFEVVATTNIQDAYVQLDSEEQKIDEATILGHYLPGQYMYTAVWKSPFGSTEEPYALHVTPTEQNELDANFGLYEVAVPDAVYDDFTYYVNGVALDKATYAPDNVLYIPEGVTITLTASFTEDGIAYESDPLEINSDMYMTVMFPEHDAKITAQEQAQAAQQQAAEEVQIAQQVAVEQAQTEQQAEAEINNLLQQYLSMYSAGNVNSLHEVIHTSSSFYGEQTAYLQSLLNRNIQSSATSYSISSINLHTNDHFTVNVSENYSITKPNEGTNNIVQKSTYTVKRIDGQLYITALQL